MAALPGRMFATLFLGLMAAQGALAAPVDLSNWQIRWPSEALLSNGGFPAPDNRPTAGSTGSIGGGIVLAPHVRGLRGNRDLLAGLMLGDEADVLAGRKADFWLIGWDQQTSDSGNAAAPDASPASEPDRLAQWPGIARHPGGEGALRPGVGFPASGGGTSGGGSTGTDALLPAFAEVPETGAEPRIQVSAAAPEVPDQETPGVPLPGALPLLLTGLACVVFARRRRA